MTEQVQRALQSISSTGMEDNWKQAGLLNFYRQATDNWRVSHFYHLYHSEVPQTIVMPTTIPWSPKSVIKNQTIWYCDATPRSVAIINSNGYWWHLATNERHQFHAELLVLAFTILLARDNDEIRADCQPGIRLIVKGGYKWIVPISCQMSHALDIPCCNYECASHLPYKLSMGILQILYAADLKSKRLVITYVPSQSNHTYGLSITLTHPQRTRDYSLYNDEGDMELSPVMSCGSHPPTPVAPPEIVHRGGQMGPLKILGWQTKTISHNFTSVFTVVVNWPVEKYQKDLRKRLLLYFVVFFLKYI